MTTESYSDSAGPGTPSTGDADDTQVHWGTASFDTWAAQRPVEPGDPDTRTRDVCEPRSEIANELIHTAIASRSLEDIIQLLGLLRRSPDSSPTAAAALRAVVMVRSVDDVARLVEVLGQSQGAAGQLDEAVRTAAERRPVAEVGRLLELLHGPPHDPGVGTEAVRAAATRPVDDVADLINRLADPRGAPSAEAGPSDAPPAGDVRERRGGDAPSTPTTPPPRAADEKLFPHARGRRPWPGVLRRLTGAALVLCGVAQAPVLSDGFSRAWGVALAMAVLCVVVGVALLVTGARVVLLTGVQLSLALLAAHLVRGVVSSTALERVLDAAWPGGALADAPALLAAVTSVLATVALVLTLTGRRAEPSLNPVR
ncbi:hypothetical protein GCM10018785_02470 [Streptomyces longispororuber]|uniref:Uncharacterized protein n=1 Tax=Streptomyces longispororuber TaxID=68230 RepID=A0A919DEU3_9ACTN|nr:hypothetical protein [Streptomyces longispororuber]GHE36255.1 hypothetical protein GCM10018785_02470 [Streptomyces longispororuber]